MRRCAMNRWTAVTQLLLLMIAPLLASATEVPRAAGPGPSSPDVRSHAFYVLDESTASVLAARNERVAVPMASITKLMTALVVLEAGQSREQVITISADDVRGTAGNASRLKVGTRLTRDDLLRLALMSSENRAAYALCRSYPRGTDACVQAMNRKATALHMGTARFVEPTGLSPHNVASAVDLSKLVIAAAKSPVIRAYSTAASHTVTIGRKAVEFRTTNHLVESPAWEVDVQKTGYIPDAGRCLVMQTVIDNRPVVIVLLNSWGKYTRLADAQRIRTWMETRTRVAAL